MLRLILYTLIGFFIVSFIWPFLGAKFECLQKKDRLVSRVTKKCWFWAIENVGIRSSVLFVFFRFVFAIAFHSIRRPCNLNDFRVMDQAVQ